MYRFVESGSAPVPQENWLAFNSTCTHVLSSSVSWPMPAREEERSLHHDNISSFSDFVGSRQRTFRISFSLLLTELVGKKPEDNMMMCVNLMKEGKACKWELFSSSSSLHHPTSIVVWGLLFFNLLSSLLLLFAPFFKGNFFVLRWNSATETKEKCLFVSPAPLWVYELC